MTRNCRGTVLFRISISSSSYVLVLLFLSYFLVTEAPNLLDFNCLVLFSLGLMQITGPVPFTFCLSSRTRLISIIEFNENLQTRRSIRGLEWVLWRYYGQNIIQNKSKRQNERYLHIYGIFRKDAHILSPTSYSAPHALLFVICPPLTDTNGPIDL